MTLPSPKASSSSPGAVGSSWVCCIAVRTQLREQPEPSAWAGSYATTRLFPFTSFLNILVITASASALTKIVSFIWVALFVFMGSLWDEFRGGVSPLLREKLILRAEAGRTGSKCALPCCCECRCVAAALSGRGVRGFAYECGSFLVVEVEQGNNSAEWLAFTPGTVWPE